MFRSYRYLGNNKFEITDSDFVVIIVASHGMGDDEAIASEYARRNLPVAKNMALLCLYLEGRNIKNVTTYQDRFCPEFIDNWAEIAAERDRILEKLSAMK